MSDADADRDAGVPGSSTDDPALSPARCRKRAMDALARREHTRTELERRLLRAGFPDDMVAETLDQLAAEGLQSDARFLEAFVTSRYRKGKGPVRISAELSQRGFSRGDIDGAIRQSGYDWFALARDVREQRFGSTRPEDLKARARQLQFLSYRGFDAEQAHAAVPEL